MFSISSAWLVNTSCHRTHYSFYHLSSAKWPQCIKAEVRYQFYGLRAVRAGVFISGPFPCICFLFSSLRSLFFCRLNLHLFKSINRQRETRRYCKTATWETLPRIAKKYFVICIRLAFFLMLPQMSRGRKASQNACSSSLVTCTKFVFLLFWHNRENMAGVVWVYGIGGDLKIRGAATESTKAEGISPRITAQIFNIIWTSGSHASGTLLGCLKLCWIRWLN